MTVAKKTIGSLLTLACACLSQTTQATATKEEPPASQVAHVSVGYVLVPFSVTDRRGRPVKGLTKNRVALLSDGVPVDYDLFTESDDASVSFTILLDGSGSMGLVGKMDGARAAIRLLLANSRPGDDFALHVFAQGSVKEVLPFTEDPEAVRRAIDAVVPSGRTAFFDALAKMPDRSLLGRNGSRAIVLLTDGLDNASSLTREELSALLAGIEVPVFPIGLRSPSAPLRAVPGAQVESLLNIEILGDLARLSGGRLAVVTEPDQLADALSDIQKDLRSQYLIGFLPTGRGMVRYRKLTIVLKGPARLLRVRAGYKGTEAPVPKDYVPKPRPKAGRRP